MSTAQKFAGYLMREAIAAATETKAEALRQAASNLLDMDQENHRLRADSERLEWLLRNVSGAEFKKLGIQYRAGCERSHIDHAMVEQEASRAVPAQEMTGIPGMPT